MKTLLDYIDAQPVNATFLYVLVVVLAVVLAASLIADHTGGPHDDDYGCW